MASRMLRNVRVGWVDRRYMNEYDNGSFQNNFRAHGEIIPEDRELFVQEPGGRENPINLLNEFDRVSNLYGTLEWDDAVAWAVIQGQTALRRQNSHYIEPDIEEDNQKYLRLRMQPTRVWTFPVQYIKNVYASQSLYWQVLAQPDWKTLVIIPPTWFHDFNPNYEDMDNEIHYGFRSHMQRKTEKMTSILRSYDDPYMGPKFPKVRWFIKNFNLTHPISLIRLTVEEIVGMGNKIDVTIKEPWTLDIKINTNERMFINLTDAGAKAA